MSEENNVKYAYRNFGQFKITYSCENPDVEQSIFQFFAETPQSARGICEAIQDQAICEQCRYYGRRSEFVSKISGDRKILYAGEVKDITEKKS